MPYTNAARDTSRVFTDPTEFAQQACAAASSVHNRPGGRDAEALGPGVMDAWISRAVLALVVALPAAGAKSAPLPACAPHIEVSSAKVIRVEQNGVLVLADGRAVDVEGILLPAGGRDHAPSLLAHRAISALGEISRNGDATLAAEPPKEDRYGRLRAQVFFRHDDAEPWLQIAMLRRGLARVNILQDRRACASALYAAEREARAARAGIWAEPAYAVRTPQALGSDTGTFQIVEGVVGNADVRDGRAYLNFGSDWRTDFTVTIAPDDMALFRREGIDPRGYAGLRVRVRGWIESMNGPEIAVSAPEQIEVLGPASATRNPDAKGPG